MRFILALIVIVSCVPVVSALDLPLSVEESAGIARKAVPVCGGIPLPAGAFDKDQPFALFEDGREIPLQAVPLVVDEKGKLRWILLDFQTDITAGQKKAFMLKTVKGAAVPVSTLKVADVASSVTIDTGKIVLSIAKDKPFGLFDSVTVGCPSTGSGQCKPVVTGGAASYTDFFTGQRCEAGKPESVVVEYAGPLRATVAVKGHFTGDDKTRLGYIARVTAWAGRSDVYLKYSLANSNPDTYCFRLVRDSSIELSLAAAASVVTAGGDKPLELGAQGWIHAGLRRGFAGAVKAGSGSEAKWTSPGGKGATGSEGWLLVKAGDAAVFVVDLFFDDDPPRQMAAGGNKLSLRGVTECFNGAQDAKGKVQGAPQPEREARWILDCSHLSSEYVIDFAAAGSDATALARASRAMPHVLAEPDWYFEKTEGLAVGRFGTQPDEMTCYDTWKWTYEKSKAPVAPAMNKGRYIKDLDNHYESEQDSLDALCLMYLRTGKHAFWEQVRTWANHHMDTQAWRTDGWRFKDGGVWWPKGGPLGNKPQRGADPATGARAGVSVKQKDKCNEGYGRWLSASKRCYCHNYGEGLADWYCLTGDRDALEALVDNVEQDFDTQTRAFGKAPGKADDFSRDFTRASHVAHAARLVLPTDPFIVEVSETFAEIYLKRPTREPRGLVNGAHPFNLGWAKGDMNQVLGWLGHNAGGKHSAEAALAEMKELGVTVDPANGQLTDPKTGAKWFPLHNPQTWMFPPLSRAMETYHRITGNEDVQDWLIAYGQAVAHVLYQPRHGNLSKDLLADFPRKGVVRDQYTRAMKPDAGTGEGVAIDGYLARFHPDVCARAYELCGEPFLKQRAFDFWKYGSHRGWFTMKYSDLDAVGTWANVNGEHSEQVCFTGKTLYIWSHPRQDDNPPQAVTDLVVTVNGDKATISFTAPADEGSSTGSGQAAGKVARYQVKCSGKPLVAYEDFLKAWSANTDDKVTNWWMAFNLTGEPIPSAAGKKESFALSGVPAGAKYFAVRSFDDSSNRSGLSNVAESGRESR